jgi:hypothetical protein
MKVVYLITLSSLFLLSCHHGQTRSNKRNTVVPKQKQSKNLKTDADATPVVLDTTRKLISYSADRIFSDTVNKDKFNITLYGKDTLKGTIVFKIYDRNNHQLFKDVFPAIDLLGDESDILNNKQQKDTITQRMSDFFNGENFSSPAIESNAKFDEDFFEDPDQTDKDNWQAVKADKTSVRFLYSHGYESTFGIAYAKSKRKVVEIFESD